MTILRFPDRMKKNLAGLEWRIPFRPRPPRIPAKNVWRMSKVRSYISIEVRYAETDQMGVVHHSVYPVWFETARTRFSQEMGVPYQEMEQMGLRLPVRELSVKYFAPAVYGGSVTVETRAIRLTPSRIVFRYRVLSEEKLLAEGETLHAWVGRDFHPINLRKAFPAVYKAAFKTVEAEA